MKRTVALTLTNGHILTVEHTFSGPLTFASEVRKIVGDGYFDRPTLTLYPAHSIRSAMILPSADV